MIDEDTLLLFSHFFIDTRQLEKDYLINLMLKTISINRISNDLEFKGGTALYLFHGLDRFSEDLDFLYIGKNIITYRDINSHLESVIKDFDLSYKASKNKGNIIVRDVHGNILGIRTELSIEGPLFDKTNTHQKIKIDISARNDIIRKPGVVKLVSKYEDIGTILIYKMSIEEMLTEKFCALIERERARDLYDIYFIMKYKGIKYNEEMFVEKLARKGIVLNKKIITERIDNMSISLWKEELSHIIRELPALAEVVKFVKVCIV